MVELGYNTNFHTMTKMTPFEALHGYVPVIPNLIYNGKTLIEVDNYSVQTREQIGRMLYEKFCKAQERMRMHADKK